MKLVSAHHKFPGSSLHFLSSDPEIHFFTLHTKPSAASWHFTKFPADEGIDLWRPTCEAKSPGFMDQRNIFKNSHFKVVFITCTHCFGNTTPAVIWFWNPYRNSAGTGWVASGTGLNMSNCPPTANHPSKQSNMSRKKFCWSCSMGSPVHALNDGMIHES